MIVITLLLGTVLGVWLAFANSLARRWEDARASVCSGSPARGALKHGKRLRTHGDNYQSYSYLGTALGRNAVHGRVRTVIESAYAELARRHPGAYFVYGESGWPSGGKFAPHKTHRNGLSVDFMVPVIDRRSGARSRMATHVFNLWGYAVDFDATGKNRQWRIDFPMLAAHLHALRRAAAAEGIVVQRVILAPELQRLLFATPKGAALASQLRFSRHPVWVRHDNHYHVDFGVRCQPAA